MPKIIEQMTTENQTEICNLSMFIMKSFEIRFLFLFWLSMHLDRSFLYIFDLMMSNYNYVLICNCIYIECIYVYVLPVYSEAFLPIVFWNKLLKFWYTIYDFVIYYLWGCSTGQHNMFLQDKPSSLRNTITRTSVDILFVFVIFRLA